MERWVIDCIYQTLDEYPGRLHKRLRVQKHTGDLEPKSKIYGRFTTCTMDEFSLIQAVDVVSVIGHDDVFRVKSSNPAWKTDVDALCSAHGR